MQMNELRNEIVVFGEIRSSDSWGLDYLSELRRILNEYVKPKTRAFLEWGTGNSTHAIIQWHDTLRVDRFYSIDHNEAYVTQLLPQFPKWDGFHPIIAHPIGPKASDRDQGLNYSTIPLTLESQFDFIFIDGRRRLECAFVASLLCHLDTVVVLHDYRRRRYEPMRAIYDVLEDGSQFRVMRLRRGISVAEMRGIYPPSA
jgi:hypothetical protein